MSQPPPPPPSRVPFPPPPPARPSWGGPAVPRSTPPRPLLGPRGRWLSDEPDLYPVWVAIVAVLIMTGPNLLVLVTGATGETPAQLTTIELVFVLGITLLFQLALFGAALLPLLIGRRLDRRLFGPTPLSWRVVGLGAAVGIVTIVVTYTVNALLAVAFRIEDPVEQDLVRFALEGRVPLFLTFVIAVFAAPFVEEVVFRGVLFRALLGRLGLALAAMLSAVVFAVIHVEVLFSQPVALGGLLVVGLLLALAYQWTGSLWVPIIAHAFYNGFSIGLLLLIDRLGIDELIASVPRALGALAGS